MIGIYKITNPKGRVYIGQSIDIYKRFYMYRFLHCKKQVRLYNSFLKYGYENHKFEIICECDELDLNKKERYYQEFYDVLSENGMNCVYQGYDGKSGKRSEETKRKISIKNKGSNNGMYGVKMTKEQKEIRRDYKHTKEAKSKISKRSYRGNNPNAKIVLDLNTGVYYGCVADAAEVLDIPRDRLKSYLNGRRKNKTSYIYA
jgi:group I intron endonuclease